MNKSQLEEETIERFRIYLSQDRKLTFGITDRDVVVNPDSKENFDYQLQNENGQKVAVELFRMVEKEEDLAKSKVWHKVTGFLKEAIKKKGLKGYLIYTPQFFVKKSEMEAYAKKMADVVEKGIKDNPTADEFVHEGFKFHKVPSFEAISLSYSEGARSVDSRGTATISFASKLPKKNKQVDIADHERILLVINWSFFVDSRAVIKALSSFDFEQFKNVDKIFFESKQGEFSLVYDRVVIESIKTQTKIENPQTLELLIQYLIHQLNDKNKRAFDYIKTIGSSVGNLDWLLDNEAKENLVHYGTVLLDKDLIQDAMWIVRMLKSDLNPNPTGENDLDDPEGKHNYHMRVIKNEDVKNITTVRGHLCWLMSRIISKNKPEYYTEILNIIQRYISEENLYIRIQATYPLTEFVVRKKAIKNQDETSFNWDQRERDVVRSIPLKMLRDNAEYSRVQESLLHIFDKFRDLNETEAEEVLKTLIATGDENVLHDLAALVPYFALFRKNDFPEDGLFNGDSFVAILKEQIVNGKMSMKTSLAWHLWKIMEQRLLPYENIKEYLVLFWKDDYDYQTASSFGLIFEQLAILAPDDAKMFFEKMVALLKKHIQLTPPPPHQWWIHGTEAVIGLFVSEPDRLISLVKDLKEIWIMGIVYVGDLSTIFGTYQVVANQDRQRVKIEFMKLYEEMKKLNIHIQPVDWTK